MNELQQLEERVAQLEKNVKKDTIVLFDQSNPNVRAEISLKNGIFKAELLTTIEDRTEITNFTNTQTS